MSNKNTTESIPKLMTCTESESGQVSPVITPHPEEASGSGGAELVESKARTLEGMGEKSDTERTPLSKKDANKGKEPLRLRHLSLGSEEDSPAESQRYLSQTIPNISGS
jgi:hypothetical protein